MNLIALEVNNIRSKIEDESTVFEAKGRWKELVQLINISSHYSNSVIRVIHKKVYMSLYHIKMRWVKKDTWDIVHYLEAFDSVKFLLWTVGLDLLLNCIIFIIKLSYIYLSQSLFNHHIRLFYIEEMKIVYPMSPLDVIYHLTHWGGVFSPHTFSNIQ